MDKKLYEGILEILRCYGYKFSHHIKNKVSSEVAIYYNEEKKHGVTIDVKRYYIDCFGLKGQVFNLENENLTLNSLCSFISNI